MSPDYTTERDKLCREIADRLAALQKLERGFKGFIGPAQTSESVTYLTLAECGKLYDRCERTAERWIDRGLPFIRRRNRGPAMVRKDVLQDWIEKRPWMLKIEQIGVNRQRKRMTA